MSDESGLVPWWSLVIVLVVLAVLIAVVGSKWFMQRRGRSRRDNRVSDYYEVPLRAQRSNGRMVTGYSPLEPRPAYTTWERRS